MFKKKELNFLLLLVGVELIFFILAGMGLCLWISAVNTVLIAQGCFLLLLSNAYRDGHVTSL